MRKFMICDEYGNQLCDGISELSYERTAQEWADCLNKTVYAYTSDEPEQPGYTYAPFVFEPEDS